MTVRQELQALLEQSFPQPGPVVVLPHSTQGDPPAKPTVMLRLDNVTPGAARGIRSYRYALVLLASSSEVEGSDVELEALVEDVLAALDRFDPNLAITIAEGKRGVYRGTTPAFEIPVAVHVAVTITS
jgi:hypothetical protein